MYNTLHCVSYDVTLYIVHHTTIERYIAVRIYSVEINIYGDKSVNAIIECQLSSCINSFYFTGHSVQYIESHILTRIRFWIFERSSSVAY